MARERKSNPRKMKPQFLVLCEGETEETYINFLKQRYRLPVKIVSKIIGSRISPRLIETQKKEMSSEPSKIKTFFMYDGDVKDVLGALKKCDGIMLISKPCIEIWFIAHYKKLPENDLASEACVKQLKTVAGWEQYRKAVLTLKQQESLWENQAVAVENTKNKSEQSNTYSTVYKLIEILDAEKNK